MSNTAMSSRKSAEEMPSLFVSHGSPMLLYTDCPARDFLQGLSSKVSRPSAILCISAHWETPDIEVTTAVEPETIHDFYGFPEALYLERYRAKGDPALADRVVHVLSAAGISAKGNPLRGLDHGAWVPLTLIYPQADIPVVQLSLKQGAGPDFHYRLGLALAPLRKEGVLIVASGSITHNLRRFRGQAANAPAEDFAVFFQEWLAGRIADDDVDAVMNYRASHPEAIANHPTEEHFLPLPVAIGAGNNGLAQRIHASMTHGVLAMDAYSFGSRYS